MAGYVLGMYTRYDYAEIIACWTWIPMWRPSVVNVIDVNMIKMCVRLYIVLLY